MTIHLRGAAPGGWRQRWRPCESTFITFFFARGASQRKNQPSLSAKVILSKDRCRWISTIFLFPFFPLFNSAAWECLSPSASGGRSSVCGDRPPRCRSNKCRMKKHSWRWHTELAGHASTGCLIAGHREQHKENGQSGGPLWDEWRWQQRRLSSARPAEAEDRGSASSPTLKSRLHLPPLEWSFVSRICALLSRKLLFSHHSNVIVTVV